MRQNVAFQHPPTANFHGVRTARLAPLAELRRTVCACLLWESGFYEDGQTVADRIEALVPACDPAAVAALAIELREVHHLRHAPLFLLVALDNQKTSPRFPISKTLGRVIKRADELAEFLSLYWKNGRKPIGKQVKKGLALAFQKFDEYGLAKYNRDDTIKLRDVLFMVHAKPKDEAQAALWKRLVDGTMATPDTWEVALSAGADKHATFVRLIAEKKLGYLALLRNLRTMLATGVPEAVVRTALLEGAAKSQALPYRFVAAARAVPLWEGLLDLAMQLSVSEAPKLSGHTIVLVDTSPSMLRPLSEKSDLSRRDAALGLAILLRVICQEVRVFAFSRTVAEVPPRSGMALGDAINHAVESNGTLLGAAVAHVVRAVPVADRLIVMTDEESQDALGATPPYKGRYMVNVATTQRSVTHGDWTAISGFSESVVQYIATLEQTAAEPSSYSSAFEVLTCKGPAAP